MLNWIHIEDNWDITLSYEWDSVTIQNKNLWAKRVWNYWENISEENWGVYFRFGEADAVEWYHIPSKEEWEKLLYLRAMCNWFEYKEPFAVQDSLMIMQLMQEFHLPFAWWDDSSIWVIDDWDMHWRYWTSSSIDDDKAYAFRLCWTYAFVNDFSKQHWYSVRLFKD